MGLIFLGGTLVEDAAGPQGTGVKSVCPLALPRRIQVGAVRRARRCNAEAHPVCASPQWLRGFEPCGHLRNVCIAIVQEKDSREGADEPLHAGC